MYLSINKHEMTYGRSHGRNAPDVLGILNPSISHHLSIPRGTTQNGVEEAEMWAGLALVERASYLSYWSTMAAERGVIMGAILQFSRSSSRKREPVKIFICKLASYFLATVTAV